MKVLQLTLNQVIFGLGSPSALQGNTMSVPSLGLMSTIPSIILGWIPITSKVPLSESLVKRAFATQV